MNVMVWPTFGFESRGMPFPFPIWVTCVTFDIYGDVVVEAGVCWL